MSDTDHIFSAKDRIKGVKLPTCLDEDLAELVGIIIGDGHLRAKGYEHGVYVSGHSDDDIDYFQIRIKELFLGLFNIGHVLISKRKNTNELKFVIYSKAVALFLMNTFNIPSNKSKTIRVPKQIISSSSEIKLAFLRGLADTNFSMTFKKKYQLKHYYPVIHAAFASGQLVNDVSLILDELEFPHYVTRIFTIDKRANRPQETFHIFISGKDNFNKWFSAIGSSNPKHLNKYVIWKRFGYYPPYMTHAQRVAMIAENKVGRE